MIAATLKGTGNGSRLEHGPGIKKTVPWGACVCVSVCVLVCVCVCVCVCVDMREREREGDPLILLSPGWAKMEFPQHTTSCQLALLWLWWVFGELKSI